MSKPKIDRQYSGIGAINTVESICFIYDSSIGTSGVYRAMRPTDFSNVNFTGNLSIDDQIGLTGGFVGITGNVNIGSIGINSGISASTVSNSTISGNNGTILAANNSRKYFYVQNLNSGILYVKYGANASAASFNILLKAGNLQDDGLAGSMQDDIYKGLVSVSGISARYMAYETI